MIDFDRLAACLDDPGQVEVLRPALEEYASTTRRALRLVDRLLGVEDRKPDLAREHEGLIFNYHEALVRIEALGHDLETARAWIDVLQGKVAEVEDDEVEQTYRAVGLASVAHVVVVRAARRALLAHYHPDRASAEDKDRMTAQCAAASAAFDRIETLRGC